MIGNTFVDHEPETVQLFVRTEKNCVLCFDTLDIPTTDPWIELSLTTGIHHRCVEHLYKIVVALTSGEK